jgi:hypothetical protein
VLSSLHFIKGFAPSGFDSFINSLQFRHHHEAASTPPSFETGSTELEQALSYGETIG